MKHYNTKEKNGMWGKTHTQEARKRISRSRIGEKNPIWKGDKVGIPSLHMWVKRRKKKPELCVRCRKEKPRDLANKGVYDRNLKNWEWLCRRCHMQKDGRLKRFIKIKNPLLSETRKCKFCGKKYHGLKSRIGLFCSKSCSNRGRIIHKK